MKRVLISENKELAEKHIQCLRKTAKGITALIQSYNDLLILSNIETREQVKEFLDHPGEFLDHAVLTETGITFSKKAKPLPDQVAGMFGIPYSDIMRTIGETNRNGLENMIFNADTLAIEFDKSCTAAILESFYEYSANDQESKEITKIRALCQLLNFHCDRYKINSADMTLISDRLGLKCELKQDSKQNDPGNHYEFKENITVLRSVLEYEKQHKIDN